MKFKKIIVAVLLVSGLSFLYANLVAYNSGITGVTKKSGSPGCTCHGSSPTTSVSAIISGPPSIVAGDTATYVLKLFGGPLVAGGCDIAVQTGTLSLSYLESQLRLSGGELTHTSRKLSVGGDTIRWTFKYKAPNTISQFDTLYANGNSVNGTGTSSGDSWNFAVNFKVFITAGPSSVAQTSEVVNGYNLGQNYPNPFNPSTKINFAIQKSGFVSIKLFDNLGRTAANLVNENLSQGSYELAMDANALKLNSGMYYYRIEANGFTETKKMILTK